MSVNTSTISTQKHYPPQMTDANDVFYPDDDPTIMPEGIKHFLLSFQLISSLIAFFANREDVKIFGNCMLYYEEGNPNKFVSPDVMMFFGLENTPPRVYKLWEEKIVPSIVIELASETTWFNDVSTKLAIYQKLGVKEYYVYDLEYTHLPEPLIAYHLIGDELLKVDFENERILSEELNLEFVDTGETLRLFNPETNGFLMTTEEIQAENEKLKAELAKLK